MAKGEIGRFLDFFDKRKGLDDRQTGDKTLLGARSYDPSERAPIGRRQLTKAGFLESLVRRFFLRPAQAESHDHGIECGGLQPRSSAAPSFPRMGHLQDAPDVFEPYTACNMRGTVHPLFSLFLRREPVRLRYR